MTKDEFKAQLLELLQERDPEIINALHLAVMQTSKKTTKTKNLYSRVTAVLLKLHFFPSNSGFEYLREAIILIINSEHKPKLNEIYFKIAKKYSITERSVSMAIYRAIRSCSFDTNSSIYKQFFGNQEKLTNVNCISGIAHGIQSKFDL